MPRIVVWTLKEFCDTIQKMQDNKYDCIIMIDGKRGIGKSTLGAKIMYRRNFSPKRDIVYSREDVISLYSKRKKGNIFADEMVNVGYLRDFWGSDQKTLIKIMNMYRDSCNLFIGCIPIFNTLDKHLQGLTKIRLTVIKRGLAVVQQQLSSVYTSDPWDIKNNMKKESKWLENGIKPKYHKLSTFIGYLAFNDLTPKQREEIEKIKEEKRSRLIRIEDNQVEELDYIDKLLERIYNFTMTNKLFSDYCQLTGKDYSNTRAILNKRIQENPDSNGRTLKDYLKEADNKVKIAKPKMKFSI